MNYIYRGVVNDGDMSVLSNKVSTMQAKLNHLRETEENLDRLCKAMRENYKQARKSPSNEFFAYVTRDDLLDVFGKDSVILTVRNCDTIREGKTKIEDDTEQKTLRVHGRWKKVDVRLVTTDGEVSRTTPTRTDDTESEVESIDMQKSVSASQPEAKNNAMGNRRPGRRRKPDKFELKDEDSVEIDAIKSTNLTEEEKELEERRITAKTLLGYRPPLKQRKRNFDEEWLESRYKFDHHIYLMSSINQSDFYFFNFYLATTTNQNRALPLVRLSPPRSKYIYTLRRTEGICDLFMGGSFGR